MRGQDRTGGVTGGGNAVLPNVFGDRLSMRARRRRSSSVSSSLESLPSFKELAQKEPSPKRASPPSFIMEPQASANGVPVEMECMASRSVERLEETIKAPEIRGRSWSDVVDQELVGLEEAPAKLLESR